VAKVALIERELKRDKLVAKYAKKHAELKAISTDFKRTDEERAAARLELQSCPATRTPHVSATVALSPVALVAPSVNLVWVAPRSVKWPSQAIFPASPKPAGKQAGEIQYEHE